MMKFSFFYKKFLGPQFILIFVALSLVPEVVLSKQDHFINPFLVYYGGGRHFKIDDFDTLKKFDVLILDRFRYKEKQNTWKKLKSRNREQKIFLYQLGPEISTKKDHYRAFYLNNIGRFDVSRGHSMGNVNNNNEEFFLLDRSGNRIFRQQYPDDYLLDFGNPEFSRYWLEATVRDIVDRAWVADGVMMDNGLTYYVRQTKWHQLHQPKKYSSALEWDEAMNGFIRAASVGLRSKGQLLIVNRGNSRHKGPIEAWVALDEGPAPPEYVFEEGAFAASWGQGSVQFWPVSQWERQIKLPSLINNSGVALLGHTDLFPGESGVDSLGNKVDFEQVFFYALGSYLLAKRSDTPKTLFSFDYGRSEGAYKRISWFEVYQALDFGEAISSYQRLPSERNIYYREFEGGYVYVNPSKVLTVVEELPKNSTRLLLDLEGNSQLLESNAFTLGAHSSAFFIKSKVGK